MLSPQRYLLTYYPRFAFRWPGCKRKMFFSLVSLGKESWFPATRESQPPADLSILLSSTFLYELHFNHLSSLTESSLREKTISILYLPSAQGIAECFAFCRSSINICKVNGRINTIKGENYSSSLSQGHYSLVKKKCQLYSWHILLYFISSVLRHNPMKKRVSSSVSFLIFSLLLIGLLIRMLKSNPTPLFIIVYKLQLRGPC